MKWHQDIQFWPHTNYDLLTIGVFLEDVEPGMGEVGFVSGSHDGPLFDLYDGDVWVGALSDADVARAAVEPAEYPVGPAGTITVHNCRTVMVRAEPPTVPARCCSRRTAGRRLRVPTDLVKRSPHGEEPTSGARRAVARVTTRGPCLLPPDGLPTRSSPRNNESAEP